MTVLRCRGCNGSGKVMGGGMLQKDCDQCNGSGKKDDGVIRVEDIKETDSYKKAISDIKKLDTEMSDERAKEIFDEQFKKLDGKGERTLEFRKKPGRPKK